MTTATPTEPTVAAQVLKGEDYTLITLTNTSAVRMTNDTDIKVNIPFKCAELHSFDGRGELTVSGNVLKVSDITDGALIILR